MRPKRLGLPLLSLTIVACASSGGPSPTSAPPRTAPPPPPPTAEMPETAAVPEAAPDGWQNLDRERDGVYGVSSDRALELLADREPARTVVVAVIDGGVDTAHVDLRDAMWHNPDETPGNDRDDDGNGYVDDVFGWNFIGGPDGRNVDHDTYELTRLYALCRGGTPPAQYDCDELAADFEETRAENAALMQQVEQIDAALTAVIPVLQRAAGTEELTPEAVEAIQTTDPQLQQMRDIWLQLSAAGITPEYMEDVRADVEAGGEYSLNPDFDPRDIVGDDYSNGDERQYGNADVMGPGADHGTHVSGIIAAARNGMGNDGIAAGVVSIMAVRAVPDGDERDKDVANAIRYAVDEGAHIINMSFGKGYSPRKHLVDEAVRYADERGVLIIHAAGNDGADLEVEDNYPNRYYDDGGQAANWVTIGASTWRADSLAATFSNYARTKVDVFAPGIEILSTVPDGEWERSQGTSMAAPVATGVAALLMAYFPDLTASEVREILLESAVRHPEQVVARPGDPPPPGQTGPTARFGDLSVTGGVVNAYEAVRLALER